MKGDKKPILARCRPEEFTGRDVELDRIGEHAAATVSDPCRSLLAAPMAGASEVLRQAYDHAFHSGSGPIPFYFEIGSDRTLRGLASRFLREFLLQTVAFRR